MNIIDLQTCVKRLLDDDGLQAILSRYAHDLTATGLRWDMAIRYIIAAYMADCETGTYPQIVSGYRSPGRQIQLINAWNSGNGDKYGLVARPASRSWHMQGLAVDVTLSDARTGQKAAAFEIFKAAMMQFGCRWGGNFDRTDPVHFDLPMGEPLTAQQIVAGGQKRI